MNVLEEAIIFATKAHEGQTRKLALTPYILHPLEVANIISTITPDLETAAAGVLHDTVEDCDVDPKEIRDRFGPRVAALVQSETEDKLSDRPPAETWQERKEDSLLMLRNTRDRDVKILWLADKLANLRSFYRSHCEIGDGLWEHLHQKDPAKQRWYYETVADCVRDELADTAAFREFCELIPKTFEGGTAL